MYNARRGREENVNVIWTVKGKELKALIIAQLRSFEMGAMRQVREHSSAVERCGPHVAIYPALLRSSNSDRGDAPGGGRQR